MIEGCRHCAIFPCERGCKADMPALAAEKLTG